MPADNWMAMERLDTFDCTLANLSEVLFDCLEAAEADSVTEIGAEHGLFTRELLEWGSERGLRRVVAIDPAPRQRLRTLAEKHPELELVVSTSHEAIPKIALSDAVIIDGDHNYFTVSEELRLLAERSYGPEMPLVLLHDAGWPLARRDSYHDPRRIPPEHRQPLAEGAFLVPGEPGLAERGLYYECAAVHEGGEKNGVLTAIEDFLADKTELEMAFVPLFFGLVVVWHRDAPWARALAEAVAPWDRNPLLERVERKRIDHLVLEFQHLQQIDEMRTADYEMRFDVVGKLLPIYDSSAFAIAERLSRIRQRGRPNFSRQEFGQVMAQLAGEDIDLDRMRADGERAAAAGESRFKAPTPATDLAPPATDLTARDSPA